MQLFLLILALGFVPLQSGSLPVFLVKRQGASLQMVRVEVFEGQPLTLKPGVDVVAVVVPVSEGQSADLVRIGDGIQVRIEAQAERLRVSVNRGTGEREVLDRPLRDLQTLRVGVHVTTGDGLLGRWRIDRWATISSEPGPVMNLFAGRIRLELQDSVVSTLVESAPKANGSLATSTQVPLTWTKEHPTMPLRVAGRLTSAVVDTAAATTLVASSALPAGQAVSTATMTEHSAGGLRTLTLEAQGAGGATTGFGTTSVPFAIGDLDLGTTSVLVPTGAALPASLPKVILGLDVLTPLGCLRFERGPGEEWSLHLGPAPIPADSPTVDLPLIRAGALLGVEAQFDGRHTFLVLDTGSPHTFVPSALALEAGWALTEAPGPAPRGLDGRTLATKLARTKTFELGGWSTRALPVRVSDLPILAKFEGKLPVGILGNDVLTRWRIVDVDFSEGRLRLWR